MGIEDKLGVEYGYSVLTSPGIAKNYKAIGPKKVKFSDVCWGDIQVIGPITLFGKTYRSYNWSKLDAAVKDWQTAGFDIQMVLRSKCSWGTAPTVSIPSGILFPDAASAPPTSKYYSEYLEWLKQAILRYSGIGGSKTMPGLIRPIRFWEIESEQGSPMFWMGTDEDYIRLLAAANFTIKVTDPNAKIILGGLNFSNGLNDDPSDAIIEQRLSAIAEPIQTMLRNGVAQFYKLLDRPDLFDIIEFHNLLEYTSIPYVIKRINSETQKRGYTKEVWVGDANSAPQVQPSQTDLIPLDPYAVKMGQVLFMGTNYPGYPQALAWLRAEQARLAIKKYTYALAFGASRIYMGLMEDWPWYTGYPYNGLTESNGSPRPVWNAIQSYAQRITGFDSITEVSLGGYTISAVTLPTFDICLYRLTSGDRTIYIGWTEPGNITIQMPFVGTQASIWTVPTTLAEGGGLTTTIPVVSNTLTLKLTTTPIIIS